MIAHLQFLLVLDLPETIIEITNGGANSIFMIKVFYAVVCYYINIII